MMKTVSSSRFAGAFFGLLALLCLGVLPARAADWWDKQWPLRKPIQLDASSTGVALPDATGPAPVLVRLHGGNFQFAVAAADGRDLRFIAAGGQSPLPHRIESYDPLLNEAFVWVLAPEIAPGVSTPVHLYYGNPAAAPAEAASVFDAPTLLAYHFAGSGAPQDASGKGHHAAAAGVPANGAIIGTGLRLIGGAPLVIPAQPTFTRAAGQPLTWSAWVKVATLAERAVLFHWGDAASYLQIGLAAGSPYVETRSGPAAAVRSAAAAPVAAGAWKHLAIVATATGATVYVDGEAVSRLESALPALAGPAYVGADAAGAFVATGEVDELLIAGTARSAGWVKFAAVSQSGSNDSLKLVSVGNDEGGAAAAGGHGFAGETLEHMFLFGDIAKNMMFDGWIAVIVCIIMMIIGWIVALQKFAYLKKVEQGTEEFLRQWKKVSTDLTALDKSDASGVKAIGSDTDPKLRKLMEQSPLYHIYHIGSEEIRHRLESKRGFHGLTNRSITAIKASLDAGLTREVHRLNSGLVSLTIGIAGGPYVGLMGTVVGVMITFAIIAKSGEVEVNSIAPGIASALLATVFGLLVAIPALFLYSFLNSRIKDAISNMQLFIDEFITKMAEFYPTKGEGASESARPIPVGPEPEENRAPKTEGKK